MKRQHVLNLKNIQSFAPKLAAELRGGETLALVGPLGSGKTTFAKALAKALKIKRKVTSPTFIMMHQFMGRLKTGKKINLYHLDLYRAKNFSEVKNLGLAEIWNRPENITVIEWANKIKRHLPRKTISIKFSQNKQ